MNASSNHEPSAFGALLRRFRLRAGMTQEQLADRARISPRGISDLERGVRRYPRPETRRLLGVAMDLAEQDLAALEVAALRPSRPSARSTVTGIRSGDSPELQPGQTAKLVGRQHEMMLVEERLEAARLGRGGLLLISGEPGIGKSRLLKELAKSAQSQRWLVMGGRALDNEAMPPYLPFAEALRDYLRDSRDAAAIPALVTDASDIANLLPELKARLPELPLRPSLGPEADRYRLFEAVRGVLERAARTEGAPGLLFCLEDLHWADASTLLLLEHVVRGLSGAPFLVVATYRDFELNLRPALAETLTRLLRERLSESLLLPRLALADVGLMLAELAGATPPGTLVDRMFAETEGNPLFVEEVFRYLSHNGQVFGESGGWLQDLSAWDGSVPQGVSLVIGGRFRQASVGCRGLLSMAAVIGRTFRHEVLKAVSGLEDEVFYDFVEEAQRMHMLTPAEGGTLSFTHDLIRQTLLSELSLPRRQRLHERVAEAMEDLLVKGAQPQFAELAAHYRLANTPEALRKAVDYAGRAAAHAAQVYAYREAAELYEQALGALDLLAPGSKKERCDLLLALGGVLLPAGESLRVINYVAPLALQIAESTHDDPRARQACALATEAHRRRGMRMVTLTDEWQSWARMYDLYAGQETPDRVRLNIDLAEYSHITGQEAEARRRRTEALETARRIGTTDEILRATSFCIYYTQAPSHQLERLRLAEEAAGWQIEGASAETLAYLYLYEGWVFWDWGRRADAESAWLKLHALPLSSPDNFASFFSFFADGCAAAIEGRLEEVVTLALQAVPTGDRLGSSVVGQMSTALIAFRPLLHLGRAGEAAQLMERAWRGVGVEMEPAYFAPRRLLSLAHQGRSDEARTLLSRIMIDRAIGPSDDGNVAACDLLPLLEASVLLEHNAAAETLSARLAGVSGLIESHVGTNTSVGRHLGGAALLLGDRAKAREYFMAALDICQKVGFRPEAALVHLELSMLDSSPRDRGRATEHLDFSIAEFTDMKMQPALERAVERKELLVSDF